MASTASAQDFRLEEAGNGFGQLLPYRIQELDDLGQPTGQIIDIRSVDTLARHVSPTNGVLEPAPWSQVAELPGGASGNHYLFARFSAPIDVDSVFDPATGALRPTVAVGLLNGPHGDELAASGRIFVGGATYHVPAGGGTPVLQRWVVASGGQLVANAAIDNDQDGMPDGLGFPGTEAGTSVPEGTALVDRSTIVFVADADGDLGTHDTMGASTRARMRLGAGLRSQLGDALGLDAVADASLGADISQPQSINTAVGNELRLLRPGNGVTDADPRTVVEIAYTEPMQPATLGPLEGSLFTDSTHTIFLHFGGWTTEMSYTLLPRSIFDLSRWVLTPDFAFPGGNGAAAGCPDLGFVGVTAFGGFDLAGFPMVLGGSGSFRVGEGPGLVNAPVAPDAIYAARAFGQQSISVVDLNGFGQSTGNPTFDPLQMVEGNTVFPHNPNVKFQGNQLVPPLAPGACTIDGGSAGVFTLTKDSSLDDRLAREPIMASVGDMALGHALDGVFNAALAPFGCQAGGNLCAIDGLKEIVREDFQGLYLEPDTNGAALPVGSENLISWAPHPNPPPLMLPGACAWPTLLGQEPTSVATSVLNGLTNLLAPGDAFGVPAANIPPSGLLGFVQRNWFQGPGTPSSQITDCLPYMIRQQVGHFLYAIDRERDELCVLNSNRMTVIERIALPDPTELAVGPNLDLIAVTNQHEDTVSFIDIDPNSATFHQIVATTLVGNRPRGIAWDPGNEDLLVTNEGDGTLSVISAHDLQVRKTVSTGVAEPFAVAITPRQVDHGFSRNVYFGYVLGRDGRLAIFESGPDGVNGWGYDDVIGSAQPTFWRPKAIQVDPDELGGGVWIAHEDFGSGSPLQTVGRLSRVRIDSSTTGQIPLVPGTQPQFRQMDVRLASFISEPALSGKPIDIAFDDLANLGGLPNDFSIFSAGTPLEANGKGLVRDVTGHGVVPTSRPRYLFAAIPGPAGVIDVFDEANGVVIDTNAYQVGVQSIPAPGVRGLMSYFRQ